MRKLTSRTAEQGVKVSPFDSAKAALRVKSVKYIKVSIVNATYRESETSTEGVHGGSAATEEEDAGIRTTHRTAPIDAEGIDIEERTIAVAAVARHGQFKRRGKSACCILAAPT